MPQALVVTGPGDLEVQDVSLRALGDDDVRVRIAGVGVCHSDLSMVNGTLRPSYPLVLGHEASGVVTEVGTWHRRRGRAARRPQLGGAVPHLLALRRTASRGCARRSRGCTGTPGGTLADGTPFEACLGLGAMAEEVVVPATAVVPLPGRRTARGVGAARLRDPHRRRCRAQRRPGPARRHGAGPRSRRCRPLGRDRAPGSRAPARIIAVDVSDSKESLARTAGATDFLVASPDLAKQVRGLTDGRGADQALECVGSATTIRQAWTAVRRGGTCVVVGVGPKDQQVTFNPLELFHFSRTLVSSIYGNSDAAPRHLGPPGARRATAASTSPPPSPTGSPSPTSRRPSSACNAARVAGRS